MSLISCLDASVYRSLRADRLTLSKQERVFRLQNLSSPRSPGMSPSSMSHGEWPSIMSSCREYVDCEQTSTTDRRTSTIGGFAIGTNSQVKATISSMAQQATIPSCRTREHEDGCNVESLLLTVDRNTSLSLDYIVACNRPAVRAPRNHLDTAHGLNMKHLQLNHLGLLHRLER